MLCKGSISHPVLQLDDVEQRMLRVLFACMGSLGTDGQQGQHGSWWLFFQCRES